jgi:pimeloyl-ACP methyl ester carboxylesterase
MRRLICCAAGDADAGGAPWGCPRGAKETPVSHADVNGLSLYYAEHGSGEPLVLLHGGFGSGEMFGPVLPALARNRRVIAVDLQGHGRTADVDRPLRYETMAGDIAALIGHLGLVRSDVMGVSLGAGVALRTVIQHPEVVDRLVLVSVPCRRDGWFPEIGAAMRQFTPEHGEAMKRSPMYAAYARVAPRPEDWRVLHAKMGELLSLDYDWSADVAEITAPTMLAYADADSIRPMHMVEFFALLGGGLRDADWDGSGRPPGRLAVLPGTTHYDIFTAPALAAMVEEFLEAPAPGP